MTRRQQVIAGSLALLVLVTSLIAVRGAFHDDSRDRYARQPDTSGGATSAATGPLAGPGVFPAQAPFSISTEQPGAQPVGYGHESAHELPKDRAARMLADNRPREALALSQYALQTRLGDGYWVEAIPTLVHSAHRLGELEDLLPLMLAETVRPSPEYPDEIYRFQSSILVGFIEALVEVGRADLAQRLLEAVRASQAGDSLDEVIASYRVRIARILAGDPQPPALDQDGPTPRSG